MKTCRFTTLMIAAVAFTMPASPANAQDGEGASARQTASSRAVEITPFVAMDSRGGVPVGTAVSFPLGSSFSVEAEVDYRRGEGDLSALSSSANLLYDLPRVGRITPYLATGVGLAQYGAPIVGRQGSIVGTQPRISLEVNAGGGLEVPVKDNWGMRTDARWFKRFGRDGAEHFRVSQGVSFDVRKK